MCKILQNDQIQMENGEIVQEEEDRRYNELKRWARLLKFKAGSANSKFCGFR